MSGKADLGSFKGDHIHISGNNGRFFLPTVCLFFSSIKTVFDFPPNTLHSRFILLVSVSSLLDSLMPALPCLHPLLTSRHRSVWTIEQPMIGKHPHSYYDMAVACFMDFHGLKLHVIVFFPKLGPWNFSMFWAFFANQCSWSQFVPVPQKKSWLFYQVFRGDKNQCVTPTNYPNPRISRISGRQWRWLSEILLLEIHEPPNSYDPGVITAL